jgi:LPXTG-site transpeptidase (sortase) family protein
MYKLTILVGLTVIGLFATSSKQQTFAEIRTEIPKIAEIATSGVTIPDSIVTQKPQAKASAQGLRLQIDAISLNIPLGKTTLGKNQELLVPANPKQAAWYKLGPKFGAAGTALITGHLDSAAGPGVFWNLKKLVTGDLIEVKRDDGQVVTYSVDKLESYRQDQTFPWNLVYSSSGDSQLRIITCDGTYNPSTARYSHNLVVYASLVK